jgi:two-component system, response regulator PdtaR
MTVGQGGLRVLVVENESLLRVQVEQFLLDLGHTIAGSARSAQRAIAEAERTRPDIVLMDIELDGPEDGIYAAHQIRSRFGILTLFMTGSTDPDTYKRALLAQPLAYLAKPISLARLREALSHLAPPAGLP